MSGVRRQELIEKILNPEAAVQVYPAKVLSVEGETCTVEILSSGLEVDEVKLQASQEGGFVLTPRVGSAVLVGLVENDVANLYVAQVSEIDGFSFSINNVSFSGSDSGVEIKKEGVSIALKQGSVEIEQDGTEVTLAGGTVTIKNQGASLKDLFTDLTTLLNSFVVITSTGPSTGLSPTSTAAILQLSTKVNALLS